MPRWLAFLIIGMAALLWLSGFFVRWHGMGLFTGVATYLVCWWIVLFALLPIGVRGQFEDGEVTPGTEPGAPVAPNLKQKFWWATIAGAAIWIVLFVIVEASMMIFVDRPFAIRF